MVMIASIQTGAGAVRYIVALIFCIFMGITGISLGIGSGWPQINQVATPFVCPGGTLTAKQKVTRPAPGKTYTQAFYACEDASGNQTPVSMFLVAAYAGTIQGFGLFVVVALLMMLGSRGSKAKATPQG
jgi:hypothetical protein